MYERDVGFGDFWQRLRLRKRRSDDGQRQPAWLDTRHNPYPVPHVRVGIHGVLRQYWLWTIQRLSLEYIHIVWKLSRITRVNNFFEFSTSSV